MSTKRNSEDDYDELSDSDDYNFRKKKKQNYEYYLKYLKYKLKYINLKKMLNNKNLQ